MLKYRYAVVVTEMDGRGTVLAHSCDGWRRAYSTVPASASQLTTLYATLFVA